MTDWHDEPALADALIRAEASAALNGAGCRPDLIELFLPAVTDRLRYDAVIKRFLVLDDDHAVRAGVSVAQLAREVRTAYDRGANRGRFFTQS